MGFNVRVTYKVTEKMHNWVECHLVSRFAEDLSLEGSLSDSSEGGLL